MSLETAPESSVSTQSDMLRFVDIPSSYHGDAMMPWPGLQFDNHSQMYAYLNTTKMWNDHTVRTVLAYELINHLRSSKNGSRSKVVLLLGKQTPNGMRSIYGTCPSNDALSGLSRFVESFDQTPGFRQVIEEIAELENQSATAREPMAITSKDHTNISDNKTPKRANGGLENAGREAPEKQHHTATAKDAKSTAQTPNARLNLDATSFSNPGTKKATPVPSKRVSLDNTEAITPMRNPRYNDQSENSGTTSATQKQQQRRGDKRKKTAEETKAPSKSLKKSTSRKQKVVQSQTDDKLPTFITVRRLLKKAGFKLEGQPYHRAGIDPIDVADVKKGEDVNTLRANLCEHGVCGVNKKVWTTEEKLLVQKWVRTSIVKHFVQGATALSSNQAIGLLMRLGFKYRSNPLGTEHCYFLPNTEKKEGKLGFNMFKERGSHGLFAYLGHVGLPDDCKFDDISDIDRASLELFLAEEKDIETFSRWQRNSDSIDTGNAQDTHFAGVQNASPSSRSRRHRSKATKSTETKDRKVKQSERAEKMAPVRGSSSKPRSKRKRQSNDTQQSSSGESSSKKSEGASKSAKKKKLQESGMKNRQKPASKQTVAAISSNALSPDHASIARSKTSNISGATTATVVSLSSLDDTSVVNLHPDLEATYEGKLEVCLKVLDPTQPNVIQTFDSSRSHFQVNLSKVFEFITAAIESGDDDGDAAALHVCGAPGIGKTSGVLGCCRKAISDVSIADEDDLTPVLIHVNAGHLASGADPTRQLLDTMSESLGMRACKNKASIEKHLKNKRKLALVVLDEIDMLVSGGKTQVAAELLGTEAVVQTLLDWSNGTANVALIAISNSTGNDKFARLHSIGKFKETVTFKPYGEDDIIQILEARLGKKVFHKAAIKFVARCISSTSGDARKALELAAGAVKECLKLPRRENAPGPLVDVRHVNIARQKVTCKLASRIDGLPTLGKVILCILSILTKTEVTSTTLGQLKNFVEDCMNRHHQDSHFTMTEFVTLVETLIDMGLLTTGKTETNKLMGCSVVELFNRPINFCVQLEDIERVLQDDLGQKSYYQGLLQSTWKNRGNLIK